MGITFSVDGQARIVRMHYVGAVSIDHFRVAMGAVFADPGYRRGFGFLVDRRNTEPPTAEYIEGAIAFALENQERLRDARWAVITAGGGALQMAGTGERLARQALVPQCVALFDDIEPAEGWLRLTAESP
jgi:hypothetical protein